jgi:hypothetical protein
MGIVGAHGRAPLQFLKKWLSFFTSVNLLYAFHKFINRNH